MQDAAAPPTEPSHLGLCVTDLDRSLRFWCDDLGFEKAETLDVGNEFGASLEVEGDVAVTSQFIRSGAWAIELLHYRSPGTFGKPSMRRNQVGLTHLSFTVTDLAASAAHLVECGGTVDEVRVELIRYPTG
jgi:lactoylglutathione lyase